MRKGKAAACELTGFVPAHADACDGVARRLQAGIMFREPGKSAQSLIADNYAMKGFRIDTKSCTWGPMRGFVCVDPRLSKPTSTGGSYAVKNEAWTAEALGGHITEKFFGKVDPAESADWVADVMPIVISRERIEELQSEGHIRAQRHTGPGAAYYTGTSTQTAGGKTVTLPWRLMSTANATNAWLRDQLGRVHAGEYYVLCVEARQGFQQGLPRNARNIPFRGFDTVLGLTNPGSKHLGFKACVTADYDLFAIWPQKHDAMRPHHSLMAAIQKKGGGKVTSLPGNVARMPKVDDRLQKAGHREHFRYGDVSARILTIKTLLNTAIMGAGYRGGNAIHHNDEQGNMALAKGSLAECLPVMAFLPFRTPSILAIQTVDDFRELVLEARAYGYETRAKPSWLKEARVA